MASTKPPARKDRSTVVIEKVETEADRQFQELLRKQISTDVSLHYQLETRKDFEKSTIHDDSERVLHGTKTLGEFQEIQKEADERQVLRSFGLTTAEIDAKVKADREPPAKKSRILERIEEKMASKMSALEKPISFRSTKLLSRHEMDLEKAIQSSGRESTFGCLVADKDANATSHKYPHPEHPMNKITSLLDDSDEETEFKFIGPATKPEGFVSAPLESKDGIIGPWVHVGKKEKLCQQIKKKRTGREYCVMQRKGSANVGCIFKTNDTKVRILNTEVKAVPLEVILRGRLTVTEIQSITKFCHYEPGHPSETLFVKNLHPSVDEAELAEIFLSFERDDEQKIVFRLLCGRMKGQAFVRFPDAFAASSALSAVNGFQLKGRPMIVQFAHSANA